MANFAAKRDPKKLNFANFMESKKQNFRPNKMGKNIAPLISKRPPLRKIKGEAMDSPNSKNCVEACLP